MEFITLLEEADRRLDAQFHRYDAGDPAAGGEIRAVLNRRRYISNLLSQIDSVLVP
jgi:hypothetical protein